MLCNHLNLFTPSQQLSTPPSPMKTRPLPTPSMESIEEFSLSDIPPLEYDRSRKSSSTSIKADKPILVIEYLEEKLREYN